MRMLTLELGKLGKGVGGGSLASVALVAAAAPLPGVAGAGEADFRHEACDCFLVETDRRGEIGIDGIVAASRAHLARMTGKPVGKVNADPAAAEAAEG